MPLYAYECTAKEVPVRFEQYVFSWKSPLPECPDCLSAEKVEKVWHTGNTRNEAASVYPYITTNINGSPIEVQSSRHLSQLERQYNVRLRDDRSYIDEDPMAGAREVNAKRREARKEAFIQQWREMRG